MCSVITIIFVSCGPISVNYIVLEDEKKYFIQLFSVAFQTLCGEPFFALLDKRIKNYNKLSKFNLFQAVMQVLHLMTFC